MLARRLLPILVTLAVPLLAVPLPAMPAHAEGWAVSVDVPVAHVLDDGTTLHGPELDGAVLGLNLGASMGIGATVLNIDRPDELGRLRLLNGFWDAPLPGVSLRLGAGIGASTYEPTYLDRSEKLTTVAAELFMHLGYPVLPRVAVWVGYHLIGGSRPGLKAAGNGPVADVHGDFFGNLLTLGVRAGW